MSTALMRQSSAGRSVAARDADLSYQPKIEDRARGVRGPLLFGIAIVVAFFGVFGAWAALAPLDSAAIAGGTLIVDSNRKAIQHLEGGIVSEINVKEGAVVKAGDPLVTLDVTQPESSLGVVRGRLRAALALEARLIAERDRQPKIAFPERLLQDATKDAEVAELMSAQQRIFVSRKESIESQVAILKQRVYQFNEEIKGLQGEIAAQTRQLELIKQELRDVEFLLNKGLERRQRYLNLQRQEAEIEGNRGRNIAGVARSRQAIAEAELRIVDLTTNMQREVVEQLRDVQTEIQDFSQKERAAADIMRRTVIRAPVAGTVVNIKVFTEGGVVPAGGTLMELVPSKDRIIVDAKIDPNDIDIVHPGMKAQVRLTAFSARLAPILDGTVQTVSADRLLDERNGYPYYTARITFAPEEEQEVKDLTLYPGMPAEVMLIAGERTPLSYLMKPVFDSFRRSMKEQ